MCRKIQIKIGNIKKKRSLKGKNITLQNMRKKTTEKLVTISKLHTKIIHIMNTTTTLYGLNEMMKMKQIMK